MSDERPPPDERSPTEEPEREGGPPDGAGGGDDGSEDADDASKPISIRDAMPPPGLRGQKPRPQSPSRGKRERRPEGALDGGTRQPTPVREVMDVVPAEIGPASPTALPSRRFEVGDEEWIVRLSGSTVTGLPADTGAPLMHLTFFRADDPETPVRAALGVGETLDALGEEELRDRLRRAHPVDAED